MEYTKVDRPNTGRIPLTISPELEAAILDTVNGGAVTIAHEIPSRLRAQLSIRFYRKNYRLRSKITNKALTVWLEPAPIEGVSLRARDAVDQ